MKRNAVWRVATVGVPLAVAANAVVPITAFVLARAVELDRPVSVDGVSKLFAVDSKLWRGARPSVEGYRGLASAGVQVIVDLRAEKDAAHADAVAARAGLRVVHLPVRDGQPPTREQVARLVEIVERSDGPVFLHCGAGVGRTGAMVAAYLVETGQSSGPRALLRNLAIGPPSFEQIWFAGSLASGRIGPPPAPVIALSRVLDAPRRLFARLRQRRRRGPDMTADAGPV